MQYISKNLTFRMKLHQTTCIICRTSILHYLHTIHVNEDRKLPEATKHPRNLIYLIVLHCRSLVVTCDRVIRVPMSVLLILKLTEQKKQKHNNKKNSASIHKHYLDL